MVVIFGYTIDDNFAITATIANPIPNPTTVVPRITIVRLFGIKQTKNPIAESRNENVIVLSLNTFLIVANINPATKLPAVNSVSE